MTVAELTHQPSHPENCLRHTNPWLKDGIINIRAGMYYWKVRFASLASICLALPCVSVYAADDGCPTVDFEDRPEDLVVFIKAIFDSRYIAELLAQPIALKIRPLGSIVRLCHKYAVRDTRKLVVSEYCSAFPTRLPSSEDIRARGLLGFKAPNGATLLEIAEVALWSDMPWILPVVFYLIICSLTEKDIVQSSLSNINKQALLQGYNRILFMNSDITGFLESDPDRNEDGQHRCYFPERCEKVRRSIINTFHHNIRLNGGWISPLTIWEDNFDWRDFNVCSACLDLAQRTYQQDRLFQWERLPGLFGLPDWDELEGMKTRALTDTTSGLSWKPSSATQNFRRLWVEVTDD